MSDQMFKEPLDRIQERRRLGVKVQEELRRRANLDEIGDDVARIEIDVISIEATDGFYAESLVGCTIDVDKLRKE